MLEIAAIVEVGVASNRIACHFVKGNVLRRKLWRRGDAYGISNAFGIANRPALNLHATQTAAHYRGPLADAQPLHEPVLALYPVAHGDHGEIGAKGLARSGVYRRWAGAASAAA